MEHLELGRYSDKDAQIPNPFVDKLGMTPAAARVRIDRSFIRWDPKTTNGFTNVTGGIALVETDFKNNKRTIDRSYFAAYERAFREGGVDYNLGVRLIAQEQEVDGNNFPKGRPYRHFLRADSELRGVVHPSSSDVFVFGLALSHRMVDDDVFLKSSDNEIRQMVVSPFVENQLALADKKVFLITGIRGDMYQGLEGVASPRAGLIFLISSEQAIKLG